jgi:hypothetical protein
MATIGLTKAYTGGWKHLPVDHVSFGEAQFAFADPKRVIARDLKHGKTEDRFYCFGIVKDGIMTVRFTYRERAIRIFGAGYWRQGKVIYERENQIHK